MLTLTNPWWILVMFAIVAIVIYFAKNLYLRNKNDHTLNEKLKNAGIHPTIRKPFNPSDKKGGNKKTDKTDNH